MNLATSTAQLSWVDSMPAGTVYQVQTEGSGANYATVGTLTASGTGTELSWQQTISATTVYRVEASYQGQTYDLDTLAQQTTVTATLPSVAPAIVLNPSGSPLTGTVDLSVSGLSATDSVNWYCDTTSIGTSSTAPLAWNSSAVANGTHVLIAIVQISADSSITIREQIVTSNSGLTITASAAGSSGTVELDVSASAFAGIGSVSATLDGHALGTLSSPNACSRYCTGANTIYQFPIDATAVGSGTHTAVVTATDTLGASRSLTLSVVIQNPPALSVTSPVDGAYIDGSGNLVLNGTATSDVSGGVTVTAALGALPLSVNQGTGGVFASSFSLAGLPAGSYTLTVTAKDSAGVGTTRQLTIVVASAAQTTYTPLTTLGSGAQLLAVDGGSAVVMGGDGTFHMMDPATGSNVLLSGANAISYITGWQLNGGYAYAYGQGANCNGYCIYQWDSAGNQVNLSMLNPYDASKPSGSWVNDEHEVAHDGYVVWIEGSNAYTVYDVATKAYTVFNTPANISVLGNWNYDFYVSGGNLTFFYWGEDGGLGTASSAVFDVYSWSSATGTSTQLTSGSMRNIYTQTDGVNVAWQQTPASGSSNGLYSLVEMPVVGGTPQVVSTTVQNSRLASGVLAWTDAAVSTTAYGSSTAVTALKAIASGVTSTISTASGVSLVAVGGGDVVYAAGGKLYAWNAASMTSSLISDAVPSQMMLTGKELYFTVGTDEALYAVALP